MNNYSSSIQNRVVIKDDKHQLIHILSAIKEKIRVQTIPYSSIENMDELLKEAINHD